MRKKFVAAAAISTITIVIFYMIAQLVGAGALIQLLLGIDYWIAVLISRSYDDDLCIIWRNDCNKLGTNY